MSNLNKNGFVILKKVLDKKLLNKIKNRLKELKPKAFIPCTNIPWGFGNLLDDIVFSKILESKIINNQVNKFFKSKNHYFNLLMVNNKAPYFGPSVEWHQEIYNVKTYAPGYSYKDWKNFLQIYIAIDRQNIQNGCLKVLKGSHKFGVQKNFDTINDNLSHKRSIMYKNLLKLEQNCKLINCKLEPGDAVIFNHLLVHGSSSNHSKYPRRSIVLQSRKIGKEKNTKIYKKETNYRINFVINALTKRIKELKKSNFYGAFK